MATQQDLQDLLRMLTVGRKVPMLQAMGQIKALQAADLRSITQIADAPVENVGAALKDEKAGKLLQSACKAAVKRGDSGKRPAPESPAASTAKRSKYAGGMDSSRPVEMTPQELERSLELPFSSDEERIAKTCLETNRAPVLLAFAVELLRYTMPEQPLSSRLSLAQAVVSANSRSRAVNLGLEKGPSAGEEGWGEGQPTVRILSRQVTVLKRGGYEWRGDEMVGAADEDKIAAEKDTTGAPEFQASTTTLSSQSNHLGSWAVSQSISMKDSTFVARATSMTEPSQRHALFRELMAAQPKLKTATHNAWAYRLRPSGPMSFNRVREESFDDGETGCGDLMLRILRETDAVDTMVVLTRWFGGKMLGPDRWRLMRNCVTGALSERLRKTGTEIALGGEAVWGLDLEAVKSKSKGKDYGTNVVGTQIHRPEAARSYLLKSFATAPQLEENTTKKKTLKALEAEKAENLGLLLGALRLVLDSWADHLTPSDLDSRVWSWYIKVRPEVDSGVQGWGAKGSLKLADILAFRRQDTTKS